MEIGFVLHNLIVGQAGGGVNWVRFIFFGLPQVRCGGKLGSFCIIWGTRHEGGGRIGFVSHFLVRPRSVGAEIGFVLFFLVVGGGSGQAGGAGVPRRWNREVI